MDYTDRKILEYYIIDGWTLFDIGRKLNMSRQAATKRLDSIPKKILNILIQNGCNLSNMIHIMCIEDFYSKVLGIPSSYSSCIHLGYPSDLLKAISNGGKWKRWDYKSKKKYVSQTKCVIPEYFQQAFKDNNTKCTICSSCEREKSNS